LSRIRITRKTNALDLVTEADRESEQAVIRTLNRAFPDHAILAEESGANARTSEHRWIIDPLDGTTNFAHGFPQFCVSIAYEHRGRFELAVVYDALKRELFVAARGHGARLNGRYVRRGQATAPLHARCARLFRACRRGAVMSTVWSLTSRVRIEHRSSCYPARLTRSITMPLQKQPWYRTPAIIYIRRGQVA
jgi:fructose-1,6-bisphosphatase/inositol monophosphatase family enzyme